MGDSNVAQFLGRYGCGVDLVHVLAWNQEHKKFISDDGLFGCVQHVIFFFHLRILASVSQMRGN